MIGAAIALVALAYVAMTDDEEADKPTAASVVILFAVFGYGAQAVVEGVVETHRKAGGRGGELGDVQPVRRHAHTQGGRVVAAGTPEQIVRVKESYTGRYLAPYLAARPGARKRA